jgi:hypothetical protein
MNTGVPPTLIFSDDVYSSLNLNNGAWDLSGTIYTATYNVDDTNMTQKNITVDVTGAQDIGGSVQDIYSAEIEFSIDTEAPTVSVDVIDLTLNGGNPSSLVTFTFSEVPANFDETDITPVNGTINGLIQDLGVDPTGKTYTATFVAIDGFEGTGSVTVGSDWQDAAGNNGIGSSDTVAISTGNPTVLDVTVSDLLITDADAGSTFGIIVTFSEMMNPASMPTLTFSPDVSGSLNFSSGSWDGSGMVYTGLYDILDANVSLSDITVDVTNAQDPEGNIQKDYTAQIEFSIDTLNPTVTSILDYNLDGVVSDSDNVVNYTVTVSEEVLVAGHERRAEPPRRAQPVDVAIVHADRHAARLMPRRFDRL